MITTPARKHSVSRRRGLPVSRSHRKALRRRGLRSFRCWQHLTRCYAFLHRKTTAPAGSLFRSLRRAFGAAILAVWLPALAQAETFTVTTPSDLTDPDDGAITLREAINLANDNEGPDTVTFDDGLSGAVITLTEGELAISDDLSIDASNLAEAPVLDADQKFRVMHFTAPEGDLAITKLTLRNGLQSGGGGIRFASSGSLTLTDSTVSGNSAAYGRGGGIRMGTGALMITNSTVTGNVADRAGGGVAAGEGPLTIRNSIIAGNSDDGTAPDLQSPEDAAHQLVIYDSLIGDSTGARLDETNCKGCNLTDLDPLLAPLDDNGGPTQTMLPLPGSPVIDAGRWRNPTTDQRGFERVGAPDIGAVEYQGSSDLARVFESDHDRDGSAFGLEQALGTDPFRADPGHPRNLIAPTFNAAGQPTLTFGIAEDALPGTIWIMERSTDLETFEEIYRFDGTTHTSVDGFPIEFATTATGVIITDQAPAAGSSYYRLRVALAETP